MYVIKGLGVQEYLADARGFKWTPDADEARKFASVEAASTYLSDYQALGRVTIGKLVEKTTFVFEEVK